MKTYGKRSYVDVEYLHLLNVCLKAHLHTVPVIEPDCPPTESQLIDYLCDFLGEKQAKREAKAISLKYYHKKQIATNGRKYQTRN